MIRHKAATLLIIDDSPEDRGVYKAFLCEEKDCVYTFLEAEDADEALRIFNQARVDLILLDYELPDMSGLEFLERLRDEEGDIQTPVVMITGRGSEQVAVRALKAGASDYLVKSGVTPESLYRATRNALEKADLNARLARETAEREQAEQELRESESRFRMLVESLKDYAVVMMDKEGRIASWNAGARKLFGYHDKEIVGHHFRRLFVAEDVRTKVPERELEEAATNERASVDRWHCRKDGTRFWAAGSVFPVRDASGAHRGYSKVLRDITERHQTLMRLQEAVAGRDEFLSVASHELKTPLTSVLLKTQGLLRGLRKSKGQAPDADRLRKDLCDIEGQLQRLGELIDRLLDVSHLTSKRLALNPEPLELGALVAEVLERHAETLDRSRKLISVSIEERATGLWDRARLEQVLVNIIGNAVRYAPGKPIQLRVGKANRSAFVTVADQGPGITEEHQKREERASSAFEAAGLGLGLYISRHVLQAFGGTIRVESETGRGATFTIELPIEIGDRHADAGAAAGV